MKSILTMVSVLLCAVFIVSCDDNHAVEHAHDGEDYAAHSENLDGVDDTLLDNGQKWKMDTHTRLAFAAMEAYFPKIDTISFDTQSLKKIGADLQIQINGLIQDCTMSGDAHDQLHVYLMGYISAVDALSQSGDIQDARKVRYYLGQYIAYFE